MIDLPNSLAIAPTALGHVGRYVGCSPDAVAAFLEAGSVEALDTSCVATMSPAPLTMP